jgi:CheY-like chemotaxis protein
MTQDVLRKLVVLFVDDNELFASFMSDRLRDLGCRVLMVHDGPQALAVLAANPDIDLLITDFRMPGMDGIELLRRVRENGYKGLAVLSSSQLPEAEVCQEVGSRLSVGFLEKPYSPKELSKFMKAAAA